MADDDDEDGKREGMDRAARHANPHWWQCMMECARVVAEGKPYLFTDDVVRLCQERHPNATTHEGRAIGPLMRECCKLGYFEPTPDWVESTQKQNHRRPCRVWYSLLYKGRHQKPRRRKINDPRQYSLSLGGNPNAGVLA